MNTAFKLALLSLCVSGGIALAQDAAPPAGPTVWDSVFTADQAARGKIAFDAHCALCHGASLSGGDMAPALAGGGFLGKWSGQTVGDLFDRIHTSMPPDDPGSVGAADTADIEAYIFSQSQLPAGSAELAHDSQMLATIRILSLKPDTK